MHPKRILIISYYFAPQNLIGAVRPTKLAKYLTRMGHEVTVICGLGRNGHIDPTLEQDLKELKDVHLIHECNPLRSMQIRKASQSSESKPESAPAAPVQNSPASANPVHKIIRASANAAYISQFWLADASFRRKAIRELGRLKGTYDFVISSYSPLSVHYIASAAKRRGIAKRWIADFRDEVVMWFQWMNYRKKRYFEMVRREADLICSVSQGTLDMMPLDGSARVLFNGYDREDVPPAETSVRNEKNLRIVYCGQINMCRKNIPDRDLTPLFRALRRLMEEKLISEDEISIVYAGGEGQTMRLHAAAGGLEARVQDHGIVSRKKSIELQGTADILLLASANMSHQSGILTGKMFEYMMMDKPIICCMNGDLPGSGIKQVLTETGMGFCCEQAAGTADEEALTAYLRILISCWRKGASMLPDRNEEAIESYAYPGLAKTLDQWMDEIQ